MKILELLYYRYYKFQVKVGNRDVAPFSALLIIGLTLMLFYFSISFILITFIDKEVLELSFLFSKSLSLCLFFIIIFFLYIKLYYRGNYKKIIKEQEMISYHKGKIISILFPLISFMLFNISWILKLLKNQGKL
jgi:hypothetical protein